MAALQAFYTVDTLLCNWKVGRSFRLWHGTINLWSNSCKKSLARWTSDWTRRTHRYSWSPLLLWSQPLGLVPISSCSTMMKVWRTPSKSLWELISIPSIVNVPLDLPTRLKQAVFRLARRFPYVQREIAAARDKTLKSACAEIAKSVEGHEFAQALPENGLSKVREIHCCDRILRLTFPGRPAQQTRAVPQAQQDRLSVGSSVRLHLQVAWWRDGRALSSSIRPVSIAVVHD